jgi:2-hydroxy-6-oxonona-2,4-dienedioate hydrolase
MSRRRAAGLAVLFLFSLAFGAFVADPFALVRAKGEALLFASGARVETFRADDGTRLSVFVLGKLSEGRPVVLLHGLGADATYWGGTARALVRAGKAVLVPDAPGSGRSGTPARPDGFGLAARVAALDALLRAFAVENADLVGHSLGGWTAGAFAVEKPFRVGRLVLVDPGGLTPIAPEAVAAEKARVVPHDRAGGGVLLNLLFYRPPFLVFGFVRDAFARNYGGPAVSRTVDTLREEDGLLGKEASLPQGTVLVWGEEETLFPVSDGRRALQKIPGGRLLVITGVGHDGPLEAPEAFHEALFSALDMEPVKQR